MIKKLVVVFLLLIAFIGCNEDVNLQAEYKESVVLWSVLDNQSGEYKIYCYVTSEQNGNAVNNDANVAFMNLYQNSLLKKTAQTTEYDSVRRINRIVFKGGVAIYPGDTIRVEAILQSGKKVEGTTIIPNYTVLSYNFSTANGYSPEIDSLGISRGYLGISWESDKRYVVLPKLTFHYTYYDGVKEHDSVRVVPIVRRRENGVLINIYPNITTQQNIEFDNTILNNVVNEISIGEDSERWRYGIRYAVFELLVMDENLSAYYGSVNGFLDSYSVRLDQNIYSNVKGGMGLVGSAIVQSETIRIDPNYIRSFGYRFIYF
mgnify:CR=1 FL=1